MFRVVCGGASLCVMSVWRRVVWCSSAAPSRAPRLPCVSNRKGVTSQLAQRSVFSSSLGSRNKVHSATGGDDIQGACTVASEQQLRRSL
eukprot:scaffold95579_cov62-Phaeocystis_antarctica.AAC.1